MIVVLVGVCYLCVVLIVWVVPRRLTKSQHVFGWSGFQGACVLWLRL